MNQQYTSVSHVPVNMGRVPLSKQDPNTHMVQVVGAPPPSWKPTAGPSLDTDPSAEPAQANHRNR